MPTVYTELEEMLERDGEPQTEESLRLLELIRLEMSKIPPESAPVYAPIPPMPDDPPPPKDKVEELKRELEEYREILERVSNLQRYVLAQICAANKMAESEHILRESVDIQTVLMNRISRISSSI